MASNIAKKAVERTSNAFLAEIPHLGKDTPHRVRRGLVNLTQRPQRAQRAYLGESKAAIPPLAKIRDKGGHQTPDAAGKAVKSDGSVRGARARGGLRLEDSAEFGIIYLRPRGGGAFRPRTAETMSRNERGMQ